jgi:hypothetical protein
MEQNICIPTARLHMMIVMLRCIRIFVFPEGLESLYMSIAESHDIYIYMCVCVCVCVCVCYIIH